MSGGWNTIESDAGVFTFLIESLGVKNVQFEELLTLDPESLQSLNPFGVIFLFKYPTTEKPSSTQPLDGEFDFDSLTSTNPEEAVWFAAQTIQNACGTQALLSLLLNKSPSPSTSDPIDSNTIDIGPQLREFKDFTSAFPAELRGEALSNYDPIRAAHNSFARSTPFASEEQRYATADDDDVYHFIAYTSINSTLYELDGLQRAPIRHGDVGACPAEIFADSVIPVLQRRINRYPETEIRFNLLAMCEDLRVRAREVGDAEALEREERKRRAWREENALRRHNFVAFIAEALRGVTRAKVKEGGFEGWVEQAKEVTRKRGEERRRKGVGVEEMDVE